jgi:hypothetical protein
MRNCGKEKNDERFPWWEGGDREQKHDVVFVLYAPMLSFA